MLKSAVDSKVKRFIYSASSSVYGPTENFPSSENHLPNPISPYANQKYYGELCCRMFTKVYGLETVSLRYFNVYGERQNLGGAYATVVGIFLKQKLDKAGRGEVINIGTGKNYSINELAEMIGGRKEHLKPVNEPFQNLADIRKAKKVLNWEPKMEISDWIKRYKILMEI